MKKSKYIFILFFSFFLLVSCKEWILEVKMQNMLVSFINRSNSNDYIGAAHLFYYKKNLKNKELKKQINEVSVKIEGIIKNLGQISITQNVAGDSLETVEICSNAYDEFKRKPFDKAGIFPVKFKNNGFGYIEIQIIQENSETYIRKLKIEFVPKE